MRDLRTFAEEINKSALNYRMGQCQEIRRRMHGLQRVKRRPIHKWVDIEDRFTHNLLLGNGASIAVHPGLSYPSPVTITV